MISIITPCLNRVSMIAEAVESVLRQGTTPFEHIIMDGGSTDGTLDVLAGYPHLRVISEADGGMYEAINKGIRLAQGEVIGLLNSDDFYEENIFQDVMRVFSQAPQADAVAGGATQFFRGENGSTIQVENYPPILQDQLLLRCTRGAPIINAWFFRRELFEKVGLFDTRYRYAADRDYLIRFALASCRFLSLDRVSYHYRQHADSSTFINKDSSEAPFTFEDRCLAEGYLGHKDLDPQTRRVFRYWHSQITADQCITALKRKDLPTAWGYSRRGMQRNPFWPWIFTQRAASRLARLASKSWSFRTGSP